MKRMIYQKLFTTEQRIKKGMKIERKKIKALERIKHMLQQLDHNAETMLVSDMEKLQAVLSDLKQASLSKYEKIVLREMYEYKE